MRITDLGTMLAKLKILPNDDLNKSAYGKVTDIKSALSHRIKLKEAVKHSWWN
jgi:hypothetical protein